MARLLASVATIEHHERPEYLDRLAVLRNQVFVLDHMYMSLFTTCGWILRLGVTLWLLVSIHPALALLALFALPTVLTSTWRPGVERAAEERGAAANRLARHLFDVATTAPPGKEVRVTRIGDRLVAERRQAWERCYKPDSRRSGPERHLARAGMGDLRRGVRCGRGIRVVRAPGAARRRAPGAGRGLAALGLYRRRPWARSASCAASGSTAPSGWHGSKITPPGWCRDADARVPDKLEDGIRFEHVSFSYPGTDRLVLEDVRPAS